MEHRSGHKHMHEREREREREKKERRGLEEMFIKENNELQNDTLHCIF